MSSRCLALGCMFQGPFERSSRHGLSYLASSQVAVLRFSVRLIMSTTTSGRVPSRRSCQDSWDPLCGIWGQEEARLFVLLRALGRSKKWNPQFRTPEGSVIHTIGVLDSNTPMVWITEPSGGSILWILPVLGFERSFELRPGQFRPGYAPLTALDRICTYIHTYIHACMHACMHAYLHAYSQYLRILTFVLMIVFFPAFLFVFISVFIQKSLG